MYSNKLVLRSAEKNDKWMNPRILLSHSNFLRVAGGLIIEDGQLELQELCFHAKDTCITSNMDFSAEGWQSEPTGGRCRLIEIPLSFIVEELVFVSHNLFLRDFMQ